MNIHTLTYTINRAASIKAGCDYYGPVTVTVIPSVLTQRQRDALSVIGPELKEYIWPAGLNGLRAPEIAAPLDEPWKIIALLDSIADSIDNARATHERIAASSDAASRALSRARRAKHEAAIVKVVADGMYGLLYSGLGGFQHVREGAHDIHLPMCTDPRIRRIVQEAEAYADRENAKIQAAANAATQRRSDQLAAWVAQHGTPGQKKRLARKLLPESEIINGMRAQTFAPIAGFPRYPGILEHEVRSSYGADLYATCYYSVDEADAASDKQLDLIEEVEAALPGATVELRLHKGELKDSTEKEDQEHRIVRHGLLVTLQVGELTFSRELAA